LLSTDLPVAKIAAMLGFSSPQRFHAVFRERFGMSASEFRERQKK
jgi:AraC-like DNA-binding protein